MEFFNSVLIIVAVLSLVKVSILLFSKDGNKMSNILLSVFFLIVFIYSLQGFIIENGYLKNMPWFYIWPLPIYALMHVVVFFYFKVILDNRLVWKTSYILLFIPFFIALVDVFLFISKPLEEVMDVINDAIINPADRFEKQYGMFALKEHFLIRYAWSIIALTINWIDFIPSFFHKNNLTKRNNLDKWALSFLIALSVISISTFLLVLHKCYPNGLDLIGNYYSKILFVLSIGFLLLSALPFYFPNILYGVLEIKKERDVLKNDTQEVKICKSTDDEKVKFGLDLAMFKEKLYQCESQHVYLAQNFDINILAGHLDIPVHHLSYILNQHYNLSFAAYRNKLRMEYAAKLIQEGFLCESTIEALAWECGFTSRSAFSKTFKTIMGVNPSDYAAKFQLSFLL